MDPANTFRVAVLVATAHRSDLLASRALPSIERQTRAPWRVVVVDDARNAAAAGQTRQSVRAWQPAGIVVNFLRNRRTKGASGAWNSGLDHLLRICGDPTRVFVATLDDDDRWEADHLEWCLTVAEHRGLDMVAAPFQRIEEDAEPALVIPPPSLGTSSFLVGNPGIQASNLVCRLSVQLEAGLFDESLPSCTDRDLCRCGAEGVALTDGTHVFKVFDYRKTLHSESAAAFLRSLVGAWTDARCLYPLLDFHESGHHAVLVYAFETNEPYTGGLGPGMAELLAECRRYGIVCRNLHPDNLRVVDGRVRLIDYGSDIRRLESEHEYTTMCRRAWLSYRWAGRADLKAIMRRALTLDVQVESVAPVSPCWPTRRRWRRHRS